MLIQNCQVSGRIQDGEIRGLKIEGDIPAISRGVLREAHPGYPVPRLLDQASCEAMLRRLQGSEER